MKAQKSRPHEVIKSLNFKEVFTTQETSSILRNVGHNETLSVKTQYNS